MLYKFPYIIAQFLIKRKWYRRIDKQVYNFDLAVGRLDLNQAPVWVVAEQQFTVAANVNEH